MLTRTFECPSCGAQIERRFDQSKSLVCTHCGQTSHLMAGGLSMVGEKNLLIDYGSLFQLGEQRKIGDLNLQILGRLRLDYEDGFWDEWFALSLDNRDAWWIQEDDGAFTLFTKKADLDRSLSWDSFTVGSSVNIPPLKEEVFITSKSRAKVNGGEGELPFPIIPGEPADFVDGIYKGNVISLELLPGEFALYVGKSLSLEHLVEIQTG